MKLLFNGLQNKRQTAGLALSVERLTAEREVTGSIPGAALILRVLRNEATTFAMRANGYTSAWLG